MPKKLTEYTFQIWVDCVAYLAKKLSVWAEIRQKKELSENDVPSKVDLIGLFQVPFISFNAVPAGMTIAPKMLKLFVDDIQLADKQFLEIVREQRSCKEIEEAGNKARESICKHLNKIKELNENVLPVDELVRIWKSYRCSEESSPEAVENSSTPPLIIQGDVHIGDTYSGDFRSAILSIKSTLENANQTIQLAPNVETETKAELMRLFDLLKSELQDPPPEKLEEAEAVAESAKMLVDASTKENPNRTTVRIAAEGLKAAAQNLSAAMPDVLGISYKIIKLISLLAGIVIP